MQNSISQNMNCLTILIFDMIDGFEEQTHELTDYEEKTLLPAIIKGFNTKRGESNQISSTEIIKLMKGANYKIDPARLRKIINHIRINNLIYNLIATGKGYYIATTPSECKKFITSLDQRINAIINVRDAMQYQLDMSIKAQSK